LGFLIEEKQRFDYSMGQSFFHDEDAAWGGENAGIVVSWMGLADTEKKDQFGNHGEIICLRNSQLRECS
jgi:hypothetical protein